MNMCSLINGLLLKLVDFNFPLEWQSKLRYVIDFEKMKAANIFILNESSVEYKHVKTMFFS